MPQRELGAEPTPEFRKHLVGHFRRAYDLGSFAKTVDYRAALPMDVKISVPNRDWIEAVLRQQKLR